MVEQVAADRVGGAEVDEVPGVDPVVATQVELVGPGANLVRAATSAQGEHLDGEHAPLVHRLVEQGLELRLRQVEERAGEREHLTHRHAREPDVGVAFAGREEAVVLPLLFRSRELVEVGECERRGLLHDPLSTG